MSTKTKTEYLIQRDYGTERNHKWENCITMYDYECARSYIEYSARRDKIRILKREVTEWEVVE